MPQTDTPPLTRSQQKRRSILTAGRELFLSNGYQGTSMDQVAAQAAVSKQTVYKHFGEKRELLHTIVTDAIDAVVSAIADRIVALADSTDLEEDLVALGTDYLLAVLSESVVQLRRLVIAEANRVPELASLYYEHAPARTLAAFAETFQRLHDRGLLRVTESDCAADHFAFLIVGRPIDQALFGGGPQVLDGMDVDRYVRAGVRVFLAGYQPASISR
ncbi:MAG: TetR/AcrR family transcriptional regulator, mexJK operon transcriptional repressor [Mycobacterium sp.]|jgi:TetR/AcrR family transcriptional repressor of mexJK operon|nr:TetR/AcrR family transcriptional regulator, mexJK operon transcriptional repressor [Mycobacterium sp.]